MNVASALFLAVSLTAAAQSSAAGTDDASEFVHTWDSGERLTKSDLSGLQRLRFLTSMDYPPFNYLDQSSQLSGFNVDLARAICNELALADRCEIQALPWEELQGALKSGQGEAIIAGLAADNKTQLSLEFTRPYLHQAARFVSRRDTTLDLDPPSLKGVTVGVVANSAHEKMLRAYFPGATIVAIADGDLLRAELQKGAVGAIFGDGQSLSFWLSANSSQNCCAFAGNAYYSNRFLGNGMRIAVKSEDRQIVQGLNFALKSVQEKGVLDELYLKYFPIGFY